MEPELLNSTQLAEMIGVSKKFVEKHRNRIAGSMQIGHLWRFNAAIIRSRIATGRNILE